MAVVAYVALGSNLGDRAASLDAALFALRRVAGIVVTRVAGYVETPAVGGPGPAYLNSVAALHTNLPPETLLTELLAIETRLGRVRTEKNASRTLDLDLLVYDDLIRTAPDPILPHPRLHERRFVLQPLCELAPDLRLPTTGRTVAEHLTECTDAVAPIVAHETVVARDLVGQRVLVTGSTSGIGQAIAVRLARAGANVVIHGRRSPARADTVAAECRGWDVRTAVQMADLAQPEQVQRLAEQAWAEWDGLDAVILNAGADTLTGPAAQWPFERKLAELWAVDVQTTIALGRWFGAQMVARGHGNLVTMGWDQAETGMAGDSGQLFGAAKGAIMAFTRALAVSLAPQVRVNCIAPGWIRTAWGDGASSAWHDRVKRETPLLRWGTPNDIAAAAHWFVCPAAAYQTGQTLRCNGGAVR
jgi:2-amino-4-hydroxy-6-hydroxymethyldihydropteridine diphosphokinase